MDSDHFSFVLWIRGNTRLGALLGAIHRSLIVLRDLRQTPGPFHHRPKQIFHGNFRFFQMPRGEMRRYVRHFRLLPIIGSTTSVRRYPSLPFSPRYSFFRQMRFRSSLFPFYTLFLLGSSRSLTTLMHPTFFPYSPPIRGYLPFNFIPTVCPHRVLRRLLQHMVLRIPSRPMVLQRQGLLPMLMYFRRRDIMGAIGIPFIPSRRRRFRQVVVPMTKLRSVFLFYTVSRRRSITFYQISTTRLMRIR